MDAERIEEKIDKVVAGAMEVSMSLGGLQIKQMSEVFQLAKYVRIAGVAVPFHLRENPGACLAVCLTALRFGFDPFMIAPHSFTMKKSTKTERGWEEVETLAWDSTVIRAIIEAHANLTGRIRYSYEGEGDDRVCIASCTPPGEKEPLSVRSPTLGASKAARGRNDKGAIKGSPLWESKPDQQQAYDAGRDLCRLHFPAVLMGYWDKDEMDENVAPVKDVTPKDGALDGRPGIRQRLEQRQRRAGEQRGFNHDGVTKTIDGDVAKEATKPIEGEIVDKKSTDDAEPSSVSSPAGESGAVSTSPAGVSEGIAAAEAKEHELAPADVTWKPPAVPKDGAGYPEYVRAYLCGLESEESIAAWWKSAPERKLRNALPNMSSDIFEAVERLKVARIAELKAVAA